MTYLSQTFGVEFECFLPEGEDMRAAARAVQSRLSRPVAVEGYNHETRPHWKIVTDGSLGSYERGMEVVSPVLVGEAGLAEAETVAKALTDFGCTVNKRCGFHVHVGAAVEPGAAVPGKFFRNVAQLYATFESVLDGIMPVSRRLQNNQYCRSLAGAAAAIARAGTFEEVVNAYAGVRFGHEARFYKLNLNAYRRHRTIEFRQHSGTLDSMKASRWISLCLKMAWAARGDLQLGVSAPAVSGGAVNQARHGSKAWLVGQMLLRPEGVTGREIMAALNWPSVSIPAQARACGLAFTTRREGREVRYWAVTGAAAQEVAVENRVDVSIAGFCTLIGASADEREYMEQRTRDLSGPVAWAA